MTYKLNDRLPYGDIIHCNGKKIFITHEDFKDEEMPTIKKLFKMVGKEDLDEPCYIIVDSPQHGIVLYYGNYETGEAYETGETQGYW